jgi:hypothetical protein
MVMINAATGFRRVVERRSFRSFYGASTLQVLKVRRHGAADDLVDGRIDFWFLTAVGAEMVGGGLLGNRSPYSSMIRCHSSSQ